MNHILLFENFERATKLYYSTSKLSSEGQEEVHKVTNKDAFTEYVAKAAQAMQEEYGIINRKKLQDFYYELVEYTGTTLPIVEFTKDMHNLSSVDMLRLLNVLDRRRNVVGTLRNMSSRFIRNHKKEYATPISINDFIDWDRMGNNLNDVAMELHKIKEESTPEEFERVENIAYSSVYPTTLDVLKYLQDYTDKQDSGENNFRDMVASGEIRKVGKNRRGTLYVIESHEAMRKAFGNSSWCFSRYGSAHDWDIYAGAGYVYILDAPDEIYLILADGRVFDMGNNHLDEIDGFKIMNSFKVS